MALQRSVLMEEHRSEELEDTRNYWAACCHFDTLRVAEVRKEAVAKVLARPWSYGQNRPTPAATQPARPQIGGTGSVPDLWALPPDLG
jgi:hypothetical protein